MRDMSIIFAFLAAITAIFGTYRVIDIEGSVKQIINGDAYNYIIAELRTLGIFAISFILLISSIGLRIIYNLELEDPAPEAEEPETNYTN